MSAEGAQESDTLPVLTGKDGEVAVWPTQQSRFRASLPILPHCLAVTCFVLNLIPSGWGTLLAAFLSLCYPSFQTLSKRQSFCINFLAFFAQLILTPVLLIGWVWSLMWGCAILALSNSRIMLQEDEEADVRAQLPAAESSNA